MTATGFQPLPGDIKEPKIAGRLKLAGGRVSRAIGADLNKDGVPELLVPDATGIGAWTLSGRLLWHFEIQGAMVVATSDLDGDGALEVVLSREGVGEIVVLSGETGIPLWTAPLPPGTRNYHYNIFIGKYLSSLRGQQLVLVASNPGAGTESGKKIEAFLFGFDGGIGEGELLWRRTVQESTSKDPKFIHWAHSVVGDVDNDGSPELVAFIKNGLVVLDITTGDIKNYLPDVLDRGRNYGTYVISDLNNDGLNELVVLADLLSLHLDVFQSSQAGDNILWQKQYGGVWPVGSHSLHFPGATTVNNLISDDGKEIIFSDWTPDRGWQLSILGASTGEVLHVEDGLYVLWTGDLNGDGVAEIVAAREEFLLPRRFSDIVIASFLDNRWTVLYEEANLWLQGLEGAWTSSESLVYEDSARGRSQDARRPFTVDWDRDGFLELLFLVDNNGNGISDGLLVVGYDGSEFQVERSIPSDDNRYRRIIQVLNPETSGSPILVVSTGDGGVEIVTLDGEVLGSFTTRQLYDWKYLIVDMNNDCKNEIVIEDGRGVAAIDWLGEKEIWRVPGKLLVTGELDNRAGTEVVVAQPAPGGRMNVTAITENGSVLWTTTLPGLVFSPLVETIKDASLGRFTGRDKYDVYIAGRHSIPTGNGDSDRSWVLRGDTGEVVWYNDASDQRLTLPSLGPGKEAGAVPIDVNHDGADDIVMVSQVDFVVLDGRTGAFLVDPIKVIYALQEGTGIVWQWAAFGAVAVLDANLDGKPELLVHNSGGAWGILSFQEAESLSVRGVWKQTPPLKEGAYLYAAVANVDALDDIEVIVPDGVLKIYDATTGKLKYQLEGIGDVKFVSVGDVSGTGEIEIVVSHGARVSLVRVENGEPVIVWTLPLTTLAGMPVIGDVDADGLSEILVVTVTGDLLIIDEG